ncbi:MAG TPA: peptidoglycan-binding domain-containing protein [Solirubrobacteraceae bacterium]|nr:peptidoglycan-binding domain-containing protein [Solirubrobacteraceae bacterium]
MASRGAHKRATLTAAAALPLLALCACLFGHPAFASAAANPGGAAPSSSHSSTAKKRPASKGVRISVARCVPVNNCSANARQVSTRGRLLLQGAGLKSGMRVAFPRAAGARINRRSPVAHLHHSVLGMVVSVPSSAHSGHILVLLSHGKRSNGYGPIYVVRHALHPPAPKRAVSTVGTAASGTAFDGNGMWVWYLSRSNGGNLPALVAQAQAAGISSVFVKSSDGSSNYWSQFSAALVQQLHASGLKVCAWQYVYGTNPTGEATLGAQAVAAGADCLVIDAESEYEGHYASAQTYITQLRAQVGPDYPLGLASFPYVDYHESMPYSVFLGPGGAQYNAPQMYWKEIGTSVDTVFAHTYQQNTIYGRPIFPLGQTYDSVSAADLARFRTLAGAYGATGVSYWDWQETTSAGWAALGAPLTPFVGAAPAAGSPLLKLGSKGDQVLWLQEHLASAIAGQQTTGNFVSQTDTNLRAFQTSHGLPATGQSDPATWQALLALPPVAVDWTGGGPQS